MDEINLWALSCIGIAAGFLGSTLGVGGGIFIVPIFTLVLHLPIHVAIGSSLVAIVATSCTAASVYTKAHLTNIKLGLILETTSAPGAVAGALIAAHLASPVLSASFGLILIYTAYRMIRRQRLMVETYQVQPTNRFAVLSSQLSNSYYDENSGKLVTYSIGHIPQGLGASFFGGVLSGLLGIGGGIIKVPVMNLVMGLPMKATIGTSSFMIGITAAIGAFIYYYNGFIYPIIVAPLILGIFLGARLGAELTKRSTGTLLRYVFAVLLSITSILMFLQAASNH